MLHASTEAGVRKEDGLPSRPETPPSPSLEGLTRGATQRRVTRGAPPGGGAPFRPEWEGPALLVVTDGADLIADLGDIGDLLHGFGLVGARPHVGDLGDLAVHGQLVDLLAESLAGLVLEFL